MSSVVFTTSLTTSLREVQEECWVSSVVGWGLGLRFGGQGFGLGVEVQCLGPSGTLGGLWFRIRVWVVV